MYEIGGQMTVIGEVQDFVKGHFLLVKYSESDIRDKVGDRVWHYPRVYEVIGVESSLHLTDPPKLSSNSALRVKIVK